MVEIYYDKNLKKDNYAYTLFVKSENKWYLVQWNNNFIDSRIMNFNYDEYVRNKDLVLFNDFNFILDTKILWDCPWLKEILKQVLRLSK